MSSATTGASRAPGAVTGRRPVRMVTVGAAPTGAGNRRLAGGWEVARVGEQRTGRGSTHRPGDGPPSARLVAVEVDDRARTRARHALVLAVCLALLLVDLPLGAPGAAAQGAGAGDSGTAADDGWLAGAAVRDVSPTAEQLAAGTIYLGGYGALLARGSAESQHDPIEARAFALASGEQAFVIVTLDLPGLGNIPMRRIRAEVAAETGLPEHAVMVHVSHTHGGPDFQGLWGGVDEAYQAFVEAEAAAAAIDAHAALTPATLEAGVVDEPGLHRNRRDSGVTDETDSDLTVLVARAAGSDEVIGSVVSYVAHPTVVGQVRIMHSDYVGPLVRAVEDELGGVALYVNGAQGDVAPSAPAGPDAFTRAALLGEAIASRALDAVEVAAPVPAGLEVDHRDVALEVTNPLFIGAVTILADILPVTRFYDFSGSAGEYAVDTLVTGATLGTGDDRVTLTTMPGELFTRLALEMRERMGGAAQLLLGTTHDSLGYLVPLDEWTEGEYEEGVSVEQFAGQKVFDAVADLFAADTVDPGDPPSPFELRPIVFVHGQLGSASQFESHAMRFTSNGVAQDHLFAFEYDTMAEDTAELSAARLDALDALIDDALDATGADRVNLVGHSRGTTVSHAYLAEWDRAEKVANYVNLDGRSSETPPGPVRTLAVWGEGDASRAIGGARNVRFDEQGHTQVATSAETYAEMHEFFFGDAPDTTDVLPEDEITIAGRAVIIGDNRGPSGEVGFELWEVDPATGQRVGAAPVATQQLDADGGFGPLAVEPGVTYELAVLQPAGIHHHYLQPFERTNHFIRLLTSEPGSLLEAFLPSDPEATGFTLQRNRELWGDQGERNDIVEVDGTNIAQPAVMPRARRIIGSFVFDAGGDRQTDLTRVPVPFNIFPFITAADLYLPASEDGSGTVEIAVTPRDADGRTVTLNIPDHPGQGHRMSVQFKDYLEVERDDPGDPGDPELPPPFTDVDPESAHAAAIRGLQLRGTIEGVTPDRFAPREWITRGQLATMLLRELDLEPVATGPFSDVEGTTHAGAINALAEAGVVAGREDGRFRPNTPIRRDQVATILGQAFGFTEVADGPFSDVPASNVHAGWVNALNEAGIATGFADGTYRPRTEISRAQLASLLWRTIERVD